MCVEVRRVIKRKAKAQGVQPARRAGRLGPIVPSSVHFSGDWWFAGTETANEAHCFDAWVVRGTADRRCVYAHDTKEGPPTVALG